VRSDSETWRKFCIPLTITIFTAYWYWRSSNTYFIFDEWEFWNQSRNSFNPVQLARPYMGSLNVALFMVWTVIDTFFGIQSYEPYRLTALFMFALFLFSFAHLCKRIELSLTETLLSLGILTFAGPVVGNLWGGWQFAWLLSLTTGTLAVTQQFRSRRVSRNILILALIGTSVSSSSVGLTFLTINTVIAWQTRNRQLVFGATCLGALYALWTVSFGGATEVGSPPQLFAYALTHLTTSISALIGIYSYEDAFRFLLVCGLSVKLGYAVVSKWQPNYHQRNKGDLQVLRTAFVFGAVVWTAALSFSRASLAYNNGTGDSFSPTAVRYVHVGLYLILIIGLLASNKRVRRIGLAVGFSASLLVGISFQAQQMKVVRNLGEEVKTSIDAALCDVRQAKSADFANFGRPRLELILDWARQGQIQCSSPG
jgi:hypothetical protein